MIMIIIIITSHTVGLLLYLLITSTGSARCAVAVRRC